MFDYLWNTRGYFFWLLVVSANQQERITLVVVRKTAQIPGEGRVLIHAFASPKHPSVVGPTLEFEMSTDP